MELREHLAGAQSVTGDITDEEMRRLETLDTLLVKWGRAIDLTGFGTDEERARRYFTEALASLPWIPERGQALDIGAGGGSPGLPLAVMRPALSWLLVESGGRKALFLEEAVRSLSLVNVRVARGRYEDVAVPSELSVITCRGVKLSERALSRTYRSLGAGGRFLWFSGEERLREVRDAHRDEGWELEGPISLLPAAARSGWLLVMEKRPKRG